MNFQIILIFAFTQFSGSQKFEVPFDHHVSDSRKIEIEVEFLNIFDPRRETVFILEDAFDDLFEPLIELLHLSDSINFVTIKGRKSNGDLKKSVDGSGAPDYQLAYKLFNQDQVARDIEVIRNELVSDSQIVLLGFSSSAMILQHYVSLFPQKVNRVVFINPMLFDVQENLGFPKQGIICQENELSKDQMFNFSYYNNFPRLSNGEREQSKSAQKSLSRFLAFEDKILGLNEVLPTYKNYPLLVRMFEHSLAGSGLLNEKFNKESNIGILYEKSMQLWEVYSESNFTIFGTNYDNLKNFQGKLTLIGGAYDNLIYPKSYDALAEFYSNSTLLLVKDGHALRNVINDQILKSLVMAFLLDNTRGKLEIYKKMSTQDLIFKKYYEGVFSLFPPY